MLKVLTFTTLTAIATCGTKFLPYNDEAQWPELNLYYTFKADASLHTWNGQKLEPYKDIEATAKVDSDRSKVKVDAKVHVPWVGKVNAEALLDLTEGMAYEYVPFLGIC